MRWRPCVGARRQDRGTVVGKAGTPRSYLVQIPTTCLRRNRHLVPTPNVTLEPKLTENRVIDDPDVVQPSQRSPTVACTLPVPPGTVTTVRRLIEGHNKSLETCL